MPLQTQKVSSQKTSPPHNGPHHRGQLEKFPRLGIVISEKLSPAEIKEANLFLQGVMAMGIPTIVTDKNGYFTDHSFSSQVRVLHNLEKKIYNDCDVVIFVPFVNIPDHAVHMALEHGVIPIVSLETTGAVNYNPNTETGNSFCYTGITSWEVFAALIRACETFKFPYDWKHIINQGKK